MHNAIGIGYLAITGETVENKCESLIAFHVARTFEEFIEHRADQIL